MGQKQYQFKNFQYPQDCIHINQLTVSKEPLQPKGSLDKMLLQANNQLKPVPVFKLANSLSKLTFITYNVWFQWQNQGNRVPCLLKLLEASQADFICLQEVTAPFMKVLMQTPWMSKYYFTGYPMSRYDCLILSKLPCNYYRYPYKKTGMQRSLFVAETEVNGETIAVATSHFESLNAPDIRKQQLQTAFDVLSNYGTALLMGDFNFDSSWNNEQKVLPKQYRDVWTVLKEKPLQTMPKTASFKAWRPDRILLKSDKWKPLAINRVGDFTVPPYEHEPLTMIENDRIVRTPSDHFGLTCVISI